MWWCKANAELRWAWHLYFTHFDLCIKAMSLKIVFGLKREAMTSLLGEFGIEKTKWLVSKFPAWVNIVCSARHHEPLTDRNSYNCLMIFSCMVATVLAIMIFLHWCIRAPCGGLAGLALCSKDKADWFYSSWWKCWIARFCPCHLFQGRWAECKFWNLTMWTSHLLVLW